jgi:aminopeptidase YwaD
MRTAAALLCAGLAAVACTPQADAPRDEPAASQTSAPAPVETRAGTISPAPTAAVTTPPVDPDDFDTAKAMATVRHLAGTIGPREATSPAFERAARWLGRQLRGLGYDVRRQRIAVPAGVSWGVPVDAGRSVNVIATPPGFDSGQPHLVVGAHLDTVPQAPGAEDNASGIGILLAAADATAARRTRLPVVFVAFGAEEPRSETDPEQHHFGSRTYVRSLSRGERDAVRGMISLDRVGVGARVPVGSAYDTDPVQRQLLAAARRAGVPTMSDPGQRSSDHWSFVRAGLPGARLGSTPYAGYHSAGDVVSVVESDQLERVGRLVVAWLGAG